MEEYNEEKMLDEASKNPIIQQSLRILFDIPDDEQDTDYLALVKQSDTLDLKEINLDQATIEILANIFLTGYDFFKLNFVEKLVHSKPILAIKIFCALGEYLNNLDETISPDKNEEE